ncbi:hypothetical protein MAXJ12_25588 [Mesorhizobium alhagi CCNWXJ12-2]|uniref:Uncharacterized protein n=1 Tax=Mesorhizobium alhagi CCNWXJ12-2 TaxID=1107882 RepID=H0HY39_9HYPH|nr:hypothetical protein MAXJ12_25588 [Mesorhizobium alhagi CCNWXJ12-2]
MHRRLALCGRLGVEAEWRAMGGRTKIAAFHLVDNLQAELPPSRTFRQTSLSSQSGHCSRDT